MIKIAVLMPDSGLEILCRWCDNNTQFYMFGGNYRQYGNEYVIFSFKDKNEALFFKLTWS